VSSGAPTTNHRIDIMESGTFNHSCDTNKNKLGTATFTAVEGHKYQFFIYVLNTNSAPDNTGNKQLSLKINWGG
jgi:hypothetical protein